MASPFVTSWSTETGRQQLKGLRLIGKDSPQSLTAAMIPPEKGQVMKEGTFYRIDYTSPHSLEFTAGGGYSPTLEEAIQLVERSVHDVEWQE